MATFNLNNLGKSTPKWAKRIGNALFAAAQAAAALSLVTDHQWLAIGLTFVGFIGKFLAECFHEPDQPSNT